MVAHGINLDKSKHKTHSGGVALELEVFVSLMANILELDALDKRESVHFLFVCQSAVIQFRESKTLTWAQESQLDLVTF